MEIGLIEHISKWTKYSMSCARMLAAWRDFVLSFVLALTCGSFKVCVPALQITPLHHIHYPLQKFTPPRHLWMS